MGILAKIDFHRLSYLGTTQDDIREEDKNISIIITSICVPLISIMTPFYIFFHIKNKRMNRYPEGQSTLDQIASIIFVPSVCCIFLTVHIATEIIINEVVKLGQKSNIPRLLAELAILITTAFTYTLGDGLLFVYTTFFSNLLNTFIILLALQRFTVIFLNPNYHFLVNKKQIKCYTVLIWICSTIYRLYLMIHMYSKSYNIFSISEIDVVQVYLIMNIISFGSIVFCTAIYIALFWNLFTLPRLDNFNRPEVAFLYESIPLLITRGFLFYHLNSYTSKNGQDRFVSHYFDYEMRYVIISTALVQFLSVLSVSSICNIYNFLKEKRYFRYLRSSSEIAASEIVASSFV